MRQVVHLQVKVQMFCCVYASLIAVSNQSIYVVIDLRESDTDTIMWL